MDIFLSIAHNGALLLALCFLYSLLLPFLERNPEWIRSILTGLLFGGFAILNMLEPLRFGDGVMIDPRNVIVMVAAAVGGFRAGLGTFLIVVVYRLSLGGEAMWAGFGSIATALVLGLIYKYRLRPKQTIRLDRPMIFLGLGVAIESLIWTLALPNGDGFSLLPRIALPVLLIYPFVTYSLVWLIASAYQRIELSNALLESEGRFRAIFEQSIQVLCLMDSDGTVRSVSPSLIKASQLNQSEILGKKFWEVKWQYFPESVGLHIQKNIIHVKAGQASHMTLDASNAERRAILDISIQKIKESSQILLEARDISKQLIDEKRRLELQFERERNDILTQLISDASHHLRTPLAIVSSSLYLLRKQTELADNSPEWRGKMDKHLRKLDTARQDLWEIVEDLLCMMSLDSPSAYRFEPQELRGFVLPILESYQKVADSKQITLHCTSSERKIPVYIVLTTFGRIVDNLLENAMRYTPEGGSVTVSVHAVDRMAEIVVEDTGIGIPEEELSRIFDRFYRTKNALSHSSKGTGLGLSIVKKTVEMHKGTIEVKSVLGEGTRVTVLIPMLHESVAAAD
jgi:PAS domain S-box-containing protein